MSMTLSCMLGFLVLRVSEQIRGSLDPRDRVFDGAFNIILKVFDWFAFKETLTLDYTLHWLSPKLGVTPMKFLRDEI